MPCWPPPKISPIEATGTSDSMASSRTCREETPAPLRWQTRARAPGAGREAAKRASSTLACAALHCDAHAPYQQYNSGLSQSCIHLLTPLLRCRMFWLTRKFDKQISLALLCFPVRHVSETRRSHRGARCAVQWHGMNIHALPLAASHSMSVWEYQGNSDSQTVLHQQHGSYNMPTCVQSTWKVCLPHPCETGFSANCGSPAATYVHNAF